MEFTFNLDIKAIFEQATAPERIQPMLDEAITKALKEAIRDATGYSSDFSKRLKEQMAGALPHGLGVDDVAKFQHVLNAEVTKAVAGVNAETVRTAMAKAVGDVLPDVPQRVKLSELLKLARDGFHKEDHEAFFAELEESDYGGWYLALDEDEHCRGRFLANFQLSINEHGEVFAMKFDKEDLTPSKRPTVITRFESVLICLYTGRTALDIDMSPDQVEYAAQEQHD